MRGGPCWCGWDDRCRRTELTSEFRAFAGPAVWSGGEASFAGNESFYGLLAAVLPGFRFFRFPAKFLVLTALARSGLGWARLGPSRGGSEPSPGHRRHWGITVHDSREPGGHRDISSSAPRAVRLRNDLFGPIDAAGAVAEMARGTGHGLVALASVLIVLAWRRRWPILASLVLALRSSQPTWPGDARHVIAIPQTDYEREPEVLRAIHAAERGAEPSPGPFRVHRLGTWCPPGWSETRSTRRLRDLTDWEIDTLMPDFGLLHGINYVLADESQTGRADFWQLFRTASRAVDAPTAAALGAWSPAVAWSTICGGCWTFGAPAISSCRRTRPAGPPRERSYAAFLDQTELIFPDPVVMTGSDRRGEGTSWLHNKDVQVRRNKTAFPRAWVVHNLRTIRPLGPLQSAGRDGLGVRIGFGDDLTGSSLGTPAADLPTVAYVEADDPGVAIDPVARPGESEAVRVRYDGPTRVVLDARRETPGLIVLADVFDPGWRLFIDGVAQPGGDPFKCEVRL